MKTKQTATVKSVKEFLGSFKSNVIASSRGKTSMQYTSIPVALLDNLDGADVYFIVNPSTGMKDTDVTHLATNFVDLDCGKLENGNYKSKSVVDNFKKRALKKLNTFKLKPTTIIETRNGYHAYWQYSPVPATFANRKIWRENQNRLINAFKSVGADSIVSKPNQLMRVPGTIWHKQWAGKNESFLTKIVKRNNAGERYFQTFSNDLTGVVNDASLPIRGNTQGSYKWSEEWKQKNSKNYKGVNYKELFSDIEYTPESNITNHKVKAQSSFNAQELADFLKDVSTLLYSKGAKFMAKQANDWHQKLIYG